jgi:hypothetical protein
MSELARRASQERLDAAIVRIRHLAARAGSAFCSTRVEG